MNIFLKEFAKIINQRKILIIMDGAGWHKSDKLIFPKNIRIKVGLKMGIGIIIKFQLQRQSKQE